VERNGTRVALNLVQNTEEIALELHFLERPWVCGTEVNITDTGKFNRLLKMYFAPL